LGANLPLNRLFFWLKGTWHESCFNCIQPVKAELQLETSGLEQAFLLNGCHFPAFSIDRLDLVLLICCMEVLQFVELARIPKRALILWGNDGIGNPGGRCAKILSQAA
jgi:hypothetical protein